MNEQIPEILKQQVEAFKDLALEAMDFYWRYLGQQLDRKDLGDIERKNYLSLWHNLYNAIVNPPSLEAALSRSGGVWVKAKIAKNREDTFDNLPPLNKKINAKINGNPVAGHLQIHYATDKDYMWYHTEEPNMIALNNVKSFEWLDEI